MTRTFSSSHRRAVLARRLARGHCSTVAALPLTATVDALGTTGWAEHGIEDVELARIIGTAARSSDFDRRMRPLRRHLRHRWERVAAAMDTGRSLPPVTLVRLGEVYFILDGHHRVSVARARDAAQIEARVTVGCTIAYACHCITTGDLPHKAAERHFLEHFPLPNQVRPSLWLANPHDWQRLAHAAEHYLRQPASEPIANAFPPADVARWWRAEVLPAARRCRPDSANIAADYLCAMRAPRPETITSRRRP